jgi:5-histidylcysteine sulfoxide synthase
MSSQIEVTRNPNLSVPDSPINSVNVIQQKFGTNWWTGLRPDFCPGFDSQSQSLKALPLVNLKTCSREDIRDYFNNSWTLTELLFSGLKSEEAFMRPPYHGLRHPLIFYYGHPAVLYLNKLRVAGLVRDSVDLYLEKILETGVDEMSWDDMSKNEMEWPSVETVKEYRSKVYKIVLSLIESHPDLDRNYRDQHNTLLNSEHPLWALFMGIEHEKIHFETSSVLIRELPLFLVETPKYWPSLAPSDDRKPEFNWIRRTGRLVSYGKTQDVPSYGWDNEYGSRTVEVNDFLVTNQLISNYEFYQFVKSGAYVQDKYWSQEGRMWRKFRNTKRPTFWVAHGPEGLHDYKLRTILHVMDMPLSWPAEVNFHEAQAYCNWRQEQDNTDLKYRLLTEAEFQVLLQETLSPGYDPVVTEKVPSFHFNFQSGSPRSVESDPREIKDIMGNVWQWAMDHFNPLEGFQTHSYYDDFSIPCFDGKHQMILGGSFISCGHEASRYARFHFRPHFFQHAGFRMAATCDGSTDNQSKKLRQDGGYIHTQRQETLKQMELPNWWKRVDQPLETQGPNFSVILEKVGDLAKSYWDQKFNTENPMMGKALDGATHKIKKDFHWSYQMSETFPTHSSDIEGLLQFLFDEVAQLGQKVGAPGYMGYVSGTAHPISSLAQFVSHILNQYTAHHTMAQGLVALEVEALNWFINLVSYPKSAKALFTSGGSHANMQALVAARNSRLKVEDYLKARVYASEHVHHCIGKALSFLGFPKTTLQLVPVNSLGQIEILELEKQIQHDLSMGLKPFCIVGSIGTTNTGAIDDVSELVRVKNQFQLWLHLDGAYGFLFYLTDSLKSRFGAIQEADSIVFDPHKGLQTPYGVGALLVKEGGFLHEDYVGQSFYMPPKPKQNEFSIQTDFADISSELSRDPRGLRVWLPIKMFGIQPFQLNLEEKLKLTEELYQALIKIPQVTVFSKPELSVTVFKLGTDDLTRKLMEHINTKGKHFVSFTRIKGELWIRVCVLGYRVHWPQVSSLINEIEKFLVLSKET